MISAMSYGALGQHAVRALARGAKQAGITMNTGEGGFPKYHLMEGCDLIFQMGTAKFGDDGALNDRAFAELEALPEIKMIEIKLSQGAKPGKGGLLPQTSRNSRQNKIVCCRQISHPRPPNYGPVFGRRCLLYGAWVYVGLGLHTSLTVQ